MTSVLKWFNSLQNKEKRSFICFNACEFYPSTNKKLLSKALDFASKYDPSVDMSLKSSYTQNARCCSAVILHGRTNLQTISLMSPWVLLMALKRANWSAATCYPFLLTSMAKASVSIVTMV